MFLNSVMLKSLMATNEPKEEAAAPVDGEAIDCMITPWSEWTPCSASCGTSHKEKLRMIKVKRNYFLIPNQPFLNTKY